MPETATLFPGFREHRTGPIFARVGGSGPPLLLLHGFPQTGAMWHKIAAGLAEHFTVVVPDLLGYGASESLPGDGGGEAYSKRAMARYMVELMGPTSASRRSASPATTAVGESPIVWRSTTRSASSSSRCWTSCQPSSSSSRWASPVGSAASTGTSSPSRRRCPNALISGEPDLFLDRMLGSWAGDASVFSDGAMAEYRAGANDPETVRSWCDDYRSGARYDLALDRSDRSEGRQIACPLLVLWGAGRGASRRGRFMATWRRWATDLRGEPMPCGHFIPEEGPRGVRARPARVFPQLILVPPL